MQKNNVFGLISIIILALINLLFVFPFFFSMLKEQIEIGEGTRMEMGTLLIWLLEGLLIIPFTISIIFTIISIIKKDYLVKIINLVLIIVCIMMTVLSNVWIFL